MVPSLPEGAITPTIGLGTFPFSGVFSPVDQAAVEDVLRTFVDGGGWFVESAPVYAPNAVDLAAALSLFPRADLFIATKCVTGKSADGTTVRSGKVEHLRRQCQQELSRLGVDYLDMLQMHIVPEDAAPQESIGALMALKSEGLIRNIGVSNVSFSQLQEFAAEGEIDFVQNRFSLLHRSQHRPLEEFCEKHRILFNPYQVIERGLLTDNPPLKFRDGDLRSTKYEYSGDVYHFVRNWVVTELNPIAVSSGKSVSDLALGWALRQPQIGVLSVGATTSEQIAANMHASEGGMLEDSVIRDIEKAYDSLERAIRERVGLSIDEYRGL